MPDSTLKTRIKDDMKAAMRAKEKERLSTIRMILSEIKRIEVDERIELDETRCLALLDKMCKQRRDSVKQYQDADRQELADIELAEIEVIQAYLPQQLTPEEIDALIVAAIAETGAESMKDMGKVMGMLKPKLQGRADVGAVSGLIKAKLN